MRKIILNNGSVIELDAFQKINDLSDESFGKYFSFSDTKLFCNGEILLAEPLLVLLDAFREIVGKPVSINAGYRSAEYQIELKKRNKGAATNSPHVVGMAVDIETKTREQTYYYVKLLERAAKSLGYKIRLGFEQYLDAGSTFVHVDVCPMYYAPGRPYHSHKHPQAWENVIKW